MDVEVAGDVEVDELEELEYVLAGVVLAAVIEDLAGSDVESGEQVGGPVALVVMGHRARPARFHRQRRLGAVQGLALGLLVEAEYHRPLRRIQIQPDNVDKLLLKAGISGDFERVLPATTIDGPGPWRSPPPRPHPAR